MGDVQSWAAKDKTMGLFDSTMGTNPYEEQIKVVADDRIPPGTIAFTEVKDSGARESWETGARRDTQDGKPRYDLIPLHPLNRLAMHYTNGAVKYGEHNWTKGLPISRFYASLFRHLIAFAEGDETEDHLAAVAWNAFAIMHFQNKGYRAPDGTDLNDMAIHRGDEVPDE